MVTIKGRWLGLFGLVSIFKNSLQARYNLLMTASEHDS
jgi:hypothetical protein